MQYKNMEGTNMKKFVCQVCGYVYEGEAAPAKCPQCGAPASNSRKWLLKWVGLLNTL